MPSRWPFRHRWAILRATFWNETACGDRSRVANTANYSRYRIPTTTFPTLPFDCAVRRRCCRAAWRTGPNVRISGIGSNAWAAGGARSRSGRALLANDPHLRAGIPGIWYAVEMRAPGLHVAGVTIAGIPGVLLGHNERIAWATTNAMVATLSVFRAGKLSAANWQTEIFHVRFARDAIKRYYRTSREYGEAAQTAQGLVLVRWTPYSDTRSAVSTILALDRAHGLRPALSILSQYSGPAQNFLLAGSSGQVAYHLAGPIPDDPAWGRYVHGAAELRTRFAAVPYTRLPSVAPSHSAVLVSANNKMYANGYPYRLSPMFAPPYRAYRIATLLHARRDFDAQYFARMQTDALSPADAEFAHRLAHYARAHPGFLPSAVAGRLAAWDGTFSPPSRTATLEHALRVAAEDASVSPYAPFEALRRRDPPPELIDALRDPFIERAAPWSQAGALRILHPFGPIGFPFLNGATLPGDGDEYTIRVQTPALSQSFRAVWEVGAWDRGGLSLPSGESGEIGSPHYNDASAAWVRGELQPLPFSDRAVARAARAKLLLEQ